MPDARFVMTPKVMNKFLSLSWLRNRKLKTSKLNLTARAKCKMHDVFMEKVQELHTWRQQTFGWAKLVVAHPTQCCLGLGPRPTLFRPVPPPMV